MSLYTILFVALILSVFIHSRSLVIFGIVILAWIITTVSQRLPKLAQLLFLSLVVLVILAETFFIQTKPVLVPLFDPYGNKGLLITEMALFLSIFAYWAYPKLAFATLCAILL